MNVDKKVMDQTR